MSSTVRVSWEENLLLSLQCITTPRHKAIEQTIPCTFSNEYVYKTANTLTHLRFAKQITETQPCTSYANSQHRHDHWRTISKNKLNSRKTIFRYIQIATLWRIASCVLNYSWFVRGKSTFKLPVYQTHRDKTNHSMDLLKFQHGLVKLPNTLL